MSPISNSTLTFRQPYAESRKSQVVLFLFSRFFLADVGFTFLPLAVLAVMKASLGQLSESFLTDPEWSFAAIVIFGLAMTRSLELKIKYQGDRSERVFGLARVCILGLIASVVGLALSQMKTLGLPVVTGSLLQLQAMVLISGLVLLFVAHLARALFLDEKSRLPQGTSLVRYLRFVHDDLSQARELLDNLCGRVGRYNSFKFEGPEQKQDFQEWTGRKTRDIDYLIGDMEACIKRLKKSRGTWKEAWGDIETPATAEQLPLENS